MNLKNKIAVVTGGSDGIGREVVFALAKQKVKLAIIARSKDRLIKVKKEAKKLGSPKVEIYSCDIKENLEVEDVVEKINKDFGKVDILLNIAGIWQKLKKLEKSNYSEIEEVINTNLVGLVNITRLFVPVLKKQKESAIINVSSKSGFVSQSDQSIYTASKFGVRGFTDVLKVDLKETSVRVAGIYQSGTDTNMFKKVGDKFDQKHLTNPSDLAEVVVFMLSRPPKIWLHDVRIEY